MNRKLAIGIGFLAALGAALSIPSVVDKNKHYSFADEDEMKTYGVTDAELRSISKAYEVRLKRRTGRQLDSDTEAVRQVYVAVTNAQANGAERLLKGVMCPGGVTFEKVACDYQFSSDMAGVMCDTNNNPVGYVVGLTLTAAQRAVFAKWSQGFTIAHAVSVPLRDMRAGSIQFWQGLGALGYKKCWPADTPDGNL